MTMPEDYSAYRIAVAIPCYKVGRHILDVIAKIDHVCWRIYVVDDACPERSGQLVVEQCRDPRVRVLFHDRNLGVGGAVMTAYRQAIADGARIVVKIDGDGQCDPSLVRRFVAPLIEGLADYTKGNRFFDLENLRGMPPVRIFGNAVLSLFGKLSTGYWDIFDPTNGYTAIRSEVLEKIPLAKVSQGYFFESDMLFRLNTMRAVVVDIAMCAHYADERSNMKILPLIGEFMVRHSRNFLKRIFYNYILRDVSVASLALIAGTLLVLFGAFHGSYHWYTAVQAGRLTPAGTVMLAALPILLGIQLLLSFLGYDIAAVPRRPRCAPLRGNAAWRE